MIIGISGEAFRIMQTHTTQGFGEGTYIKLDDAHYLIDLDSEVVGALLKEMHELKTDDVSIAIIHKARVV
jgi:hypothetical protein